jgi:hypothetical protein
MRTLIGRLAVFAAALLSACGGGGGTTAPPVKPVDTTTHAASVPDSARVNLSVNAETPSLESYPDALITIAVLVTSTRGGAASPPECTLDGSTVTCGKVPASMGNHTICASVPSNSNVVGDKQCQVATIVAPSFDGSVKVPTLNGEYIPVGMGIVFGDQDSTKVDVQGNYSLVSRLRLMSSVKVCFRGDAVMQPWCGQLPAKYFSGVDVTGAPVEFQAGTGTFKGQMVKIDLKKAKTVIPLNNGVFVPGNTTSLLGDLYSDADGMKRYEVGTMQLPACLAFASDSANVIRAATSADSAKFWSAVDSLELAYGQDLVKPCAQAEAKSRGVLIALSPTIIGSFAQITAVEGEFRDVRAGLVRLMPMDVAFSYVVGHELAHLIFRVGHTCEWDSMMRSSCPRYIVNGVYAEDVAYMLFKKRTRELLEKSRRTRLALAFMKE